MMRHDGVVLLGWYFVFTSATGAPSQFGPFATARDCETMQTTMGRSIEEGARREVREENDRTRLAAARVRADLARVEREAAADFPKNQVLHRTVIDLHRANAESLEKSVFEPRVLQIMADAAAQRALERVYFAPCWNVP